MHKILSLYSLGIDFIFLFVVKTAHKSYFGMNSIFLCELIQSRKSLSINNKHNNNLVMLRHRKTNNNSNNVERHLAENTDWPTDRQTYKCKLANQSLKRMAC